MTSRNEWQDIAEQASKEFDPDKLRALVDKLNRVLASEEIGRRAERVTHADLGINPSIQNGNP
jgi:hypothetical protein